MMRRYSTTLALLALGACNRVPQANAPVAAARPRPPLAASNPVLIPAAGEPAPQTQALPEPVVPSGPQLYMVNELAQGYLTLLKTDDGAAVAASSAIFSKLNDDGITLDERATQGFPGMAFVLGMAGRYPDSVWLTVEEPRGRSGVSEVFRSSKTGWARVGPTPRYGEYTGIGNWSGGRVLAARFVEHGDGTPQHDFLLLSGSKTALPVFTKPPAAERKTPDSNCSSSDTLVLPIEFAILPSGHVYSVGRPCTQELTAVEHWQPGRAKSEVQLIPDSGDWTSYKLLTNGAGELSLLAAGATGTFLASFDGTQWQSEKLALLGEMQRADRAPDGTLFVLTLERATAGLRDRPHLFERSAGQAAFRELALPSRLDGSPLANDGVSGLVASGKDDVWLLLGDSLLHTRPPPSGPRSLDFEQGEQLPAELHAHKPASEHCKDVFVLLFPISHSTPTGYDFPELRKSLAGHPEYAEVSVIETEDNGARYVGATVADFQQGSAFAKLAQKSLSSAKPSVLCAQPKPVREIPIAWSGTEPAQATAP